MVSSNKNLVEGIVNLENYIENINKGTKKDDVIINKNYYCNSNPFPKYTNGEDENLYLNISNFLKNGLFNGERTWPEYIKNIKNPKRKIAKNYYFIEKSGFVMKNKKVIIIQIMKMKIIKKFQ